MMLEGGDLSTTEGDWHRQAEEVRSELGMTISVEAATRLWRNGVRALIHGRSQ